MTHCLFILNLKTRNNQESVREDWLESGSFIFGIVKPSKAYQSASSELRLLYGSYSCIFQINLNLKNLASILRFTAF